MGSIYEKNQRSLTDCSPRPRVSSKQSNFFFRFKPKQTETQSVLVDYSVCFVKPKNFFSVCFSLFWFVSVFRTVIKTTETNRIFSKQTKNISRKRCLLGDFQNR
jgi:hypothetical protein